MGDSFFGGDAQIPGFETENKRRHLRYRLGGRGKLSFGDPPREIGVQLLDVSQGGMSVLSDNAFGLGARARLAVSILCGERAIGAAPAVEVRYCVLDNEYFRLGLQFLEPDAQTQQAIDTIVEARKTVSRGF
jgi:hypothetical protein